MFEEEKIPILEMSTYTDEGVMDVKIQACDKLLAQVRGGIPVYAAVLHY